MICNRYLPTLLPGLWGIAAQTFDLLPEQADSNTWALVREIGGRTTENHGVNNTLGFVEGVR